MVTTADSWNDSAFNSPHPEIDVLIDCYQKRLEPRRTAPVERHLVHCSQCTALLLDIESFARAESSSPPAESAEARLLARSVLGQISSESWRDMALATSLLLTTAAPAHRYPRIQGERIEAELSPEVNLPIVPLHPRSPLRDGDAARVALSPGTRFLTLILDGAELPEYPEYRLVIHDRAGREVLSLDGLLVTSWGTFHLGLPAAVLRPGGYRLALFGVAGGRREPAAEYSLQIVSA